MPGAAPRPSGGMKPGGFGQFNEGHMEQNAMKQVMGTKAMSQQAASKVGASGLQTVGGKQAAAKQAKTSQKPRPMSSPLDHLKYMGQDIKTGLKSLVDIPDILGIKPDEDPNLTERKRKMHANFQSMTDDEKQIVQQKYQEKIQREKQEEEDKRMKKQMEEQKKAQSIQMPTSPSKGPIGPGGKKKKSGKDMAMQRLQQSRTTISTVQGAN